MNDHLSRYNCLQNFLFEKTSNSIEINIMRYDNIIVSIQNYYFEPIAYLYFDIDRYNSKAGYVIL